MKPKKKDEAQSERGKRSAELRKQRAGSPENFSQQMSDLAHKRHKKPAS